MNLNLTYKTRKNKALILMMLSLCWSCQELLNFPEGSNENSIPVIEAYLTDQDEEQWVKLSFSTSLDDTVACHPVTSGKVRLISSAGDTLNYLHINKGWYRSEIFKAKSGIKYTLEATFEGITYRSTGEVIPLIEFDTIYSRCASNPDSHDSAWYVYLNAGSPDPYNVKYYQIDAIKNGELITYGSELWIFVDKYLNDIQVKLPVACKESDTLIVLVKSISKEMFDYYYRLGTEVFTLDLGSISYRANLPDFFEPHALGYFQVSAVSRKEIITGPVKDLDRSFQCKGRVFRKDDVIR